MVAISAIFSDKKGVISGKIFVAGHRGLVGSAVVRRLKSENSLLKISDGLLGDEQATNSAHSKSRGEETSVLLVRTRQQLNLLDSAAVRQFFETQRPDTVILAAAKVGGIEANRTQQADFLYENLMIAANVIHSAAETGVKKLLFLGSSCIYPKMAPQPLPESSLLTGPLEPTNEGYALAKISGLKLCEFYRQQYGKLFFSAMPTNLYGPGDQFHPLHSHVIPGMMRRFHEAKSENRKSVVLWGTGRALREFLHVDDLADGLVFLLKQDRPASVTNLGSGQEVSIAQLAELMKKVVGFTGEIEWDTTKPDGTPRKLLDCRVLSELGWQAKISLENGLRETYRWACENGVFESAPKPLENTGHLA